jgi:methionyl-tRNA formyltransferase
VPFLDALVAAGHDIALVVTQPDKRRGRGTDVMASPVKEAALRLGLPTTSTVDDVIAAGVQLGVVVAFGRLIKPHVLEKVPMVNMHFSLLPRWRGAAPVERAILAGDTRTGVCLMELEEGLDTGPVYGCDELDIDDEETADELRERLVGRGVALLVDRLANGLGDPQPQVGEPTYAAKIDPDELHIDWSQPAVDIVRHVRIGRAWTTFRGKRLRILRARVTDGPALPPAVLEGLAVGAGDGTAVELVDLQPEGRGPQAAAAWRNGAHPAPGETLGD